MRPAADSNRNNRVVLPLSGGHGSGGSSNGVRSQELADRKDLSSAVVGAVPGPRPGKTTGPVQAHRLAAGRTPVHPSRGQTPPDRPERRSPEIPVPSLRDNGDVERFALRYALTRRCARTRASNGSQLRMCSYWNSSDRSGARIPLMNFMRKPGNSRCGPLWSSFR